MTKSQRRALSKASRRAYCIVMAALVLIGNLPLAALAKPAAPYRPDSPPPMPKKVKVKTGPRKLKKVIPVLKFSQNPTDLEITSAHVLNEAFIPMSGPEQKGENQALVDAVKSFKAKNSAIDLSSFEKFVTAYPHSRWAPSIQVNLGEFRFRQGYLSQALTLWTNAWEASKNETNREKAVVASSAIANLVYVNARLGRMNQLKAYLGEISGRAFYGSAAEKIQGGREGLASMEHNPGCSFKCGPLAVNTLKNLTVTNGPGVDPIIESAKSTTDGTTLAQVKEWSDKLGLKYQLAKKSPGAQIITPCIMHWKLDHFAALVGKDKKGYHLKDPTFDIDAQTWISSDVIEKETDGYFLIPASEALPVGWTKVSAEEASNVHGKGEALWRDGYNPGCDPDGTGGGCGCLLCEGEPPPPCGVGMPAFDAYLMLATLHIFDSPLGYKPPVGPNINFRLDYQDLQVAQPVTFTYTNLGFNWNLNWVSYLTVDPLTDIATLRPPGGGAEVYAPSGGVYTPNRISLALLVDVGGGTYERRMKDGSKQVYDVADSSSPPRIFMTKVVDPQGNEVLLQYDSDFRLTTITDTIGQISTISYVSNSFGNSGFYKVASITDPFSRSCSFSYDSTNTNLLSITDVMGLTSSFQYDAGSSFISQLTTPYGTTGFYKYVPGSEDGYDARGIKFTYPDGTCSVVENWLSERKSSYIWDRHALQMYPNDPKNHDFTHCEVKKYTYNVDTHLEEPIAQWISHPLESSSPTYFTYSSNYGPNFTPHNNLPLSTSKALGNQVVVAEVGGTPKAGDVVCFYIDYEYAGYVVQSGDSLEKIADEMAKAVNTQSNYQTRGISAGACGKFVYLRSEQSGMDRYNIYLSPGSTETLTYKSQARQTAIATVSGAITPGDTIHLYCYCPAYPYSGIGRDYPYTVQSGDTATNICSNIASQVNADTLVAEFGVSAVANAGTISLTSYNQEPQVWAAGTSGTETFVFSSIRNGTVQLTENQYNSVGNITQTIDPVGRKFSYSYAGNGIDLEEKRETQGTDNYLMGHWDYNGQHLPTYYIDGSAQTTEYTYNAVGQLISEEDALGNTTTYTYTGTCPVTVGGTATPGNSATVTVYDLGLSGGSKAKTYTVQSGDTLTSIATGLKNAINGDSDLSGIGVTATSTGALLELSSVSVNVTTYGTSTSGGATATLTAGANIWGYLTKIDGPLPGDKDLTSFTYDGYGRVRTATDSQGYTLTLDYDNADRLVRTTYPDGTYEESIYDRLDEVMSKDRNGSWSQRIYNSLDENIAEIDPAGRRTEYTWCSCGSLAALKDPSGNQTGWSHDLQGRLTTKTYADSSTYTYIYEQKTSNVKRRTDAIGQKTNYFYCNDSAICQKSYPNPTNPTATVTYFPDLTFNRLTKTTKNDWGSYSYTYNNYVTSPGATPITGGGRLQLVHNDVIANSDTTYSYDALGRTTNRSIDGSNNSIDWTYDSIDRITSEVNELGTFTYAYIDNTSGSSKGDTRLASVTYPNGQVTKYDWYGNLGDQRLQQIRNLGTGSSTISQFSYRYDPAGQIKQWQQIQGKSSLSYCMGYDQASQLTGAAASGGPNSAAFLRQYNYAYDPGANRTGVQSCAITRGRVTGTATTSDVLTITVSDSGLSGGTQAVNYTVQSGDTLSIIATKMAEALTSNTNLQSIGVNASANGAVLNIKSASPNVTSYAFSSSGGATASIVLNVTDNFVENAVIGGSKTTGDILTIVIRDPSLSGGSKSKSYTVLAGDSLASIATAIKNAINADTDLQNLGVSATAVGTNISIRSTSSNATTYDQSVSSGATETISLSINQNGLTVTGISGSKTTNDTITLTTYDVGLPGGTKAVTYTVQAGDTLTSILTGLATAINADSDMQSISVSAAASGKKLSLQSDSVNETNYVATTSSAATEVLSLGLPVNGVQTASIGGTKTTGDILTVTVFDPGLTGGSKAIAYTVLSGDNLASIATNLAAGISADSDLQGISVSATSSGSVVFITSNSNSLTTYSRTTSGGATETITLAPSTAASNYGYNNLNELTSIAAGGPVKFQGNSNKALRSASVDSNAATLETSTILSKDATLASGMNNIAVAITDGQNTTKTRQYRLSTIGASVSPSFDANGNMTSDGVNTYSWDAENKLVNIDYPGSQNTSHFISDSIGRLVRIEEKTNGTISSIRQSVWSGTRLLENRDGSSTYLRQYFALGQINFNAGSPSNFYTCADKLGSARELLNSSGAIQSEIDYDPFGQSSFITTSGAAPDFGYTGIYSHERSGLNLTLFRVYSPNLGRWLSRDPLEEQFGENLYTYSANAPFKFTDRLGLQPGPTPSGRWIKCKRKKVWYPLGHKKMGQRHIFDRHVRFRLPSEDAGRMPPSQFHPTAADNLETVIRNAIDNPTSQNDNVGPEGWREYQNKQHIIDPATGREVGPIGWERDGTPLYDVVVYTQEMGGAEVVVTTYPTGGNRGGAP